MLKYKPLQNGAARQRVSGWPAAAGRMGKKAAGSSNNFSKFFSADQEIFFSVNSMVFFQDILRFVKKIKVEKGHDF